MGYDTSRSERLSASIFRVEAIHFRIILSHNLNGTCISYVTFRFKEILNFAIDSAMNYYVLEQEQRVFLSG